MLAKSNPGSDSAFLPPPFWLRTTVPPVDPTTNTANAKRHSTAAHRNRRDFMTVGSSKEFLTACRRGYLEWQDDNTGILKLITHDAGVFLFSHLSHNAINQLPRPNRPPIKPLRLKRRNRRPQRLRVLEQLCVRIPGWVRLSPGRVKSSYSAGYAPAPQPAPSSRDEVCDRPIHPQKSLVPM